MRKEIYNSYANKVLVILKKKNKISLIELGKILNLTRASINKYIDLFEIKGLKENNKKYDIEVFFIQNKKYIKLKNEWRKR